MFPFITAICNPLGGKCYFDCVYCWAKALTNRYGFKKYQGPVRIDEKVLEKPKIKDGDFVFFVDMLDIMTAPLPLINRVLDIPKRFPNAKFLVESKSPQRFLEVLEAKIEIPKNCVLGATVESNRYYPILSKAPDQMSRLEAMKRLSESYPEYERFFSVEPICDFDFNFPERMIDTEPWAVAVGYDNYNHRLPEPPLLKTEQLIKMLEDAGHKVFRKTIKKAWYEEQ